jgi:two-component system C4-dicarboxylate transport response regulator DctD
MNDMPAAPPSLRVVLIDDDDGLRHAMADSFAIAGIDVEPFADPRAARSRRTPRRPAARERCAGCPRTAP